MKNIYLKYVGIALMAFVLFGLIKLSRVMEFARDMQVETSEEKIIMIVGIIMMVHFVLLIHELGHVVMGLLQGFRFELFVVGLLGMKREKEGIRIYLNKDMGYYGGAALTLPVDDSPDNRGKFAKVLLAGPIASLVFAFICFFTVYHFANPYGIIAFTGGLASFGIFLATTIPSRSGMFFTDRKRYQRLMTPGKDQEVEWAILKILGSYVKNQSYKEIERSAIDVLISEEDPYLKCYGFFNMMCWQLEHHGAIEDKVREEYEVISGKMNKDTVNFFNDEIRKYAERIQGSTARV